MSKHSARGKAWIAQTKRVKERDGYVCTSCGATEDLTVDHVEPIAFNEGKTYRDDELVTLCRPCNSTKGDRIIARINWVNTKWLDQI